MYHPTTRVLTILELLQTYPQLSGAELAARLEVDRRTVRRYVATLQELGIPVEAERGPYGGYRLRPGFKMPPLMLSADEALAVTLSLIAARARAVGVDAHATAGALAKIERVLPQPLRERLRAVEDVVVFGESRQTNVVDGAVFLLVSGAVQERRCMRIVYRSGDATTERCVDPYGVVHQGEHWYMVGWCHLRRNVRMFRLDRIVEARTEDATFERPPDFDCLDFVHRSLATTPWGWEAEVMIRATMDEVRSYILPDMALLAQEADGVVLRAYVDNLDWLALQLLALPFTFRVRRPTELRQAFERLAAQARSVAEDADEGSQREGEKHS